MSDRVRNLRLKAAFRELVAAAGGQERAGKLCGVGQQTVSRWGNAASDDFPPLDAVAILEEETGLSAVTDALADLADKVAVPKATAGPAGEVLAKMVGAVARETGEVLAGIGGAMADGQLTADEAQGVLPDVRDAQTALHTMEQSLEVMAAGAKPRLVR